MVAFIATTIFLAPFAFAAFKFHALALRATGSAPAPRQRDVSDYVDRLFRDRGMA
jgi:hypothetical protein